MSGAWVSNKETIIEDDPIRSQQVESKKKVTVERFVSPEPLLSNRSEGNSNDQSADLENDLTHETTEIEAEQAINLRPASFSEYPGQKKVKENLRVSIGAALKRKVPMDHVILHGPPGLGKTTLARIIANELKASFYQTTGPSIDRPGDLAGILAGLEKGSLLFIDEIHRLSIQVEEVLYSAMEDYCLDIIVGQGQSARSIKMDISPFTLVGATTKLSSLSRPFLSRFGIQERLSYYTENELEGILFRSSRLIGLSLTESGAREIAKRSRGTPRVANRLLRRAWDFAIYGDRKEVDETIVAKTLHSLDIDEWGLETLDRQILKTINGRYGGGPVGIDALAVSLGEERETLEEVYEPFLVYQGFLSRGPRGRYLTEKGKQLVGVV